MRALFLNVGVFISLVGVLCLISCGQMVENAVEESAEKKAKENGEKVGVDIKHEADGVKMTFTDEDGEEVNWEMSENQENMRWTAKGEDGDNQVVIGQNAGLPNEFPADIPIYPGMTILMTHAGSENARFSIRGTSTDTMQNVLVFYAEAVAKNGWSPHPEMSEMNTGGMQQRLYRKANRTLHLTAIDNEGQTMVTIYTEKDR